MERSIRYSKKREAILAAIQGTSCHPSADGIYQQLKPSHPDLSLGTVYRNLIFFQERGDIRSSICPILLWTVRWTMPSVSNMG